MGLWLILQNIMAWIAVTKFSQSFLLPQVDLWNTPILYMFVHVCFISKLVLHSVRFSHPVVSSSLRHHESQHIRPPCPSPSPGVHSDSCPSSRWCHPAISSSVIPFSSCPQSLPASESFPISYSSHEVAKVLEFQL